ncbi:plastidial pyruvate kinase 3 [Actinidia rufa]|uniref:pyruvate kinase n=1 Tax=Actinidia rufa TaxID=165716 RepID=A0A7J0H1X5_9ERIC|nr:plastidial pyruvate kinase 3 [Actinidia rufa]
MATINLPTGMLKSDVTRLSDRFSSAKNLRELFSASRSQRRSMRGANFAVRSMKISEQSQKLDVSYQNDPLNASDKLNSPFEVQLSDTVGQARTTSNGIRKTKIVCTIGPSTSSREMICKLAETGMNVARLNMSHGDHASHQKTIDLVKEYNAQFEDKVVAIMLDTKGPEVRSGDVPQPILLKEGQEFNFTIKRGVSTEDTVSVNYDDFITDVAVGDILLVDVTLISNSLRILSMSAIPLVQKLLNLKFKVNEATSILGGMMSFAVKSKTQDTVKCEVIDGGELKSRRHLNAMVARGDLGAELPIEEVPLLQEEIIRMCHSMHKPVIVATNMLESMIDHPTPTRAEVSDIAIAVREGADAVMLSGETAHGKYPLKAVKVMHTVALRTEASLPISTNPLGQSTAYKIHMGGMFAFHATTMANTLGTPIMVFTRTGSMAVLLSHYRPSSTIFAFTNEERVKQRLALYQGVMPIYMPFSDDAEETFSRALKLLQSKNLLKEGEHVTLVQSGAQPIWRRESTHHIQVRKVQTD